MNIAISMCGWLEYSVRSNTGQSNCCFTGEMPYLVLILLIFCYYNLYKKENQVSDGALSLVIWARYWLTYSERREIKIVVIIITKIIQLT